MIILLIYCLSLAVAADLLCMFPYSGTVVTTVNSDTYLLKLGVYLNSKTLVIHYAEWFSLNIALLGAFTFLAISIPEGDPHLRLHWIGHQVLLLFNSAIGRNPPDSAAPSLGKAWLATLTCYILIAGIIAGSIVYDCRWIRNYLSYYDSVN